MTGAGRPDPGFVPRKSRGQNFLIDGRVADRHIGYAGIREGDRVLEVGPGFGVLTSRLVEAAGSLTCIELDEKLADYIEGEYGGRLTLIRGDAVKVPFPEFDVFVSNLPYSVSTPIIFKLLDYDFRSAVVMVQKEFADRMVADVGSPDYSRLTVDLFYRADCEILESVPASRFDPRPKVDSALVRIVPRKAPFSVLDEATFFRVVEVAFNHRRKKIGTSLKAARMIDSADGFPYLDGRIENLRPAEIGELADAVYRARHPGSGRPLDDTN
jgi:16S rRNA (adenine1518-N6/adenine1519-N6)-dimethyltransferase